MKTLVGGCRVYSASDGQRSTRGTWSTRNVMSRASGAALVTQTVNDYAVGSSPTVTNPSAEEVLYVARGRGTCRIGGYDYALQPGVGVFIPPGEPYAIDNPGPDTLHIVNACCPEDPGRQVADAGVPARRGEPPRRTVREDERDAIRAGRDRVFRYLVHTDLGCREVTQFVGWIPVGKAPFHRHTYEEAIYILDGQGLLHLRGQPEATEFGAGTSIYLPVGVVHCLENPGPGSIRVLGVFHPSGSPGVAYEDD